MSKNMSSVIEFMEPEKHTCLLAIVQRLAMTTQSTGGTLQIDRVPKHDDHRYQIEAAGPVTLLLKTAVTNFTQLVKNTALASALLASPLFSPALTRRRSCTLCSQSRLKSVRSSCKRWHETHAEAASRTEPVPDTSPQSLRNLRNERASSPPCGLWSQVRNLSLVRVCRRSYSFVSESSRLPGLLSLGTDFPESKVDTNLVHRILCFGFCHTRLNSFFHPSFTALFCRQLLIHCVASSYRYLST